MNEDEVIINSKPNHLYSHDFQKDGKKKGKFFSVVYQNKNEATIQTSAWVQLKIIYIYENDEISGFEITKVKKNSESSEYRNTPEKIKLSGASLGDIVSFAKFINELDLKGVSERRIKLGSESINELDEETIKKLKTLLATDDGQKVILELLDQGIITSLDIVNVGYRKTQLVIFEKLLKEPTHWTKYGQSEAKNGEVLETLKEEKVWQHFFKKNPWIFGYGLDYQFLEILQNESTVRGADVSGKGEEKLDTLAGTGKYTVLVELKKPSTEIFESAQNRANSWRLSSHLFLAVSQILEYKAAHQIEWLDEAKRYDEVGSRINHQALDPSVILVIGRESMFAGDDKTLDIKWRTFELFRRDSRNVRIFNYDELYDRAKFIVER